ncbi:hypothetical protein C8R43DRAFT_1047102 [Mycena crocata]|nr:hypothetical protein C8R43DRAFT_1047102 [Mycena crocata]
MKEIKRLGIEKRMQRRGPLWDAYSTLKKVLEERIELAGNSVHLVCSNSQCNRIDYTDKYLRYCTGCMDRSYCSIECQMRDWEIGGHHQYCKDTRERRKECKKVKLSKENINFARSVLERDRILRSFQVAAIVHRTRTLAVEFDYTVFPMEVKPFEALEAKPSYTLVQLKLPSGQQPHLLHVKYPMPRDLAESVTLNGMS